MTFCILGHCERTGQTGIGYTTVTLAGGGTSPFYSYGGDIVVVQAYGNIATATEGARTLDTGQSADAAFTAMRACDSAFEFRQVGIMTRAGAGAAWTGDKTRPWAGHHVGAYHVAMGNVLAGEAVVEAMARAFEANESETLAERLLRGIEAGRDAGGQQAPNGAYDERSALLKVFGAGPDLPTAPALDLRIDMATNAVDRMREMYEIYKPVIKRRAERARNPADDPATSVWEAEHMRANPPPPALRGAPS
jgi:uncharacterized Ntn-hydrolase superfamily protein